MLEIHVHHFEQNQQVAPRETPGRGAAWKCPLPLGALFSVVSARYQTT
ncbi:hypothetical protein IQ22_01855 [Pseudomonas duriflava]|uniref:Uncharacterized protein n=1 Tax=Pseudomonas duriflava TaxID=459528 RepID=A0A562QE19_9PSED|nr:hypothetical protein IQ22_01855 [Pseudomonas duriflava]